MAIRLMTKAERRHYENFYTYTDVSFEALRPAEGQPPVIRGYINDGDADIIIYFDGDFKTDEEADELAELINERFEKVVWDSDGPFESESDEEFADYEDENDDDE